MSCAGSFAFLSARSDPSHLHAAARVTYLDNGLVSKATLRIARDLLDRFFRDAEGKSNRQLDVYFTLEDLDLGRDKAQPAIDFLVSRGLLNQFGPDIAFLTDKGIRVAVDESDLALLPKELREFGAAPLSAPAPSRPARPASVRPSSAPRASSPTPQGTNARGPRLERPERATLTHIDLDGQEFALELAWACSIGRSDGNTIRINDKRASKNHAEIRYESGQFILRDLDSANGTLINGEYVVQPVVLKHDDEIVIGRTMLLYTAPAGALPPMGPDSEPTTVAGEEVAAGFRVIQGTPADRPRPPTLAPSGGRYTPAPITADLRPPEPQPTPAGHHADLFAEPARRSASDLFNRGAQTDDLFDARPTRTGPDAGHASQDLFDPAISSGGAGPAHPSTPSAVGLAPAGADGAARSTPGIALTPIPAAGLEPAKGLQASLQEPLEELEPFESLDEASEDEWVQETLGPPAPLLENQPVIRPGGVPDVPPEDGTLAPPSTDDMATLMVSREALFGESAQNSAESDPPRWGDAQDVHPAFGADANDHSQAGPAGPAGPAADGDAAADRLVRLREVVEGLPVAEVALAAWEPPLAPTSSDPSAAAIGTRGNEFLLTLQVLRRRIEHVDVPEKGALLEAVEVLSQHPYIRVVLEQLDD